MRAWILATAAIGFALSGCIDSRPLSLPADDPASPQAAAGSIDEPTAITDYKSATDLARRAAAEAKEPQSGMSDMPGMSGMGGMGDMSGIGGMTMQKGGARQGAAPQ